MSSIARRLHRSRPFSRAAVASLSAIFAIGLLGVLPVVAVPATPGPGYQDYVYKPLADGTGANDVTSFRNQSKLWFNDGRWWGILFDKGSTKDGTYRIQSFNMATQAWTSGVAGAPVDDRNRSHADTLWDGTNLWVISGHNHGTNKGPNGDLRIYKYSYNSTAKTYTIVSGFPHIVSTNGASGGAGTIAPTIAKAPNGVLWVTYTHGTDVMVSHSTTAAGTIWVPPFVIPGQGNPIVASNDQAAIINLSNGVGVLWSSQGPGDGAFYFQGHKDGDNDATWGTRETAYGGGTDTLGADGHISLKNDGSNRIIAAVKTNHTTGASALIEVLARTGAADAAGTWTTHDVSSVNQHGTRPVLVIDSDANQADVFITSDPTPTTRTITRRTAPLPSLNFGAMSIGTTFISSAADNAINDGTSTKQVATAASGIILLAQNIPTRRYLHGCAGTPCPVAPVAAFSGSPLSGEGPLTVTFTDASSGTPATWAWDFGDGGTSALQNPTHTFNPGTWTVALTVTNAVGTNTLTKTDYVVVSVPTAATYTAIDPTRLLDTRTGNGLSGKFVSGTPRVFQINGRGSIPSDAVAITGNLTVANQSAGGYVSLGPTASAAPTSSTLNFPKGDTRANAVTVAVDGSGQLAATFKSAAGATTNLILDVTGYFVRDTAGSTYKAIDPSRVLDTRSGTGLSGKFSDSTPRSFPVAGHGGVPAGAVAVTGNLTVVNQSKGGYVSLGPTVTSSPSFSTLNFPSGDTRANAATVALDGSGNLAAVYKASAGATTNLLFDVTGYFLHDLSGTRYIALEPVRLLDTRTGNGLSGKFTSSSPRSWIVAGLGGVPADATAVTGNLTVVNQSKGGYVSLGPTVTSSPSFSTLNFPSGDVRANAVSVALDGSGNLAAVYKASAGATTNLILDVTGYYK
jgi:PKD repeat protein